MSSTINLSDEETATLYDLLSEWLKHSSGEGDYANDVKSIKEKIKRQL